MRREDSLWFQDADDRRFSNLGESASSWSASATPSTNPGRAPGRIPKLLPKPAKASFAALIGDLELEQIRQLPTGDLKSEAVLLEPAKRDPGKGHVPAPQVAVYGKPRRRHLLVNQVVSGVASHAPERGYVKSEVDPDRRVSIRHLFLRLPQAVVEIEV